jgi:hypothetical protein
VIEVTVSRSVKVQETLDQYESTDFFMSLKDEAATPAEVTAVQRRLRDAINAALTQDIVRHYKARGRKADPVAIRKRYGLIQPKEASHD